MAVLYLPFVVRFFALRAKKRTTDAMGSAMLPRAERRLRARPRNSIIYYTKSHHELTKHTVTPNRSLFASSAQASYTSDSCRCGIYSAQVTRRIQALSRLRQQRNT